MTKTKPGRHALAIRYAQMQRDGATLDQVLKATGTTREQADHIAANYGIRITNRDAPPKRRGLFAALKHAATSLNLTPTHAAR